jgi:DNA invertase Pin-like site-specific DNA recombinase
VKKQTQVAIYARVSTTDQSPDAQLLALREYAAQRGFEIFKEYIDYVTGRVIGSERANFYSKHPPLLELSQLITPIRSDSPDTPQIMRKIYESNRNWTL